MEEINDARKKLQKDVENLKEREVIDERTRGEKGK